MTQLENLILREVADEGGTVSIERLFELCDHRGVNPAGLWRDGLIKIERHTQTITTKGRAALEAANQTP